MTELVIVRAQERESESEREREREILRIQKTNGRMDGRSLLNYNEKFPGVVVSILYLLLIKEMRGKN